VPKAYAVAVSPVRPNLAAVGTNTGMAFLTFDRMYPLPVAGLPMHNLAEAHTSPVLRLPRERAAAAYVAHMGDAVWLVSCAAVQQVCVCGRGGGGAAGRASAAAWARACVRPRALQCDNVRA
jgi:hypothetical protein